MKCPDEGSPLAKGQRDRRIGRGQSRLAAQRIGIGAIEPKRMGSDQAGDQGGAPLRVCSDGVELHQSLDDLHQPIA